eukprot:CAMPEP_0172868496 /NCGR_PEP_ID=MMETSP1075-20121228/86489_1 /TAXON_ID=2916 /ORGANISM="Ceratium fusus, Strain PA161109" /LENGTH=53 /DNA_ID=CAMNT_0013718151 /DNA_START=98 /DNA_END=255 /DNA_ORIENTATION=+
MADTATHAAAVGDENTGGAGAATVLSTTEGVRVEKMKPRGHQEGGLSSDSPHT